MSESDLRMNANVLINHTAMGRAWFLIYPSFIFFMSVTRRRTPLGQIVFGTLSHATCDVYLQKLLQHTRKMLWILVALIYVKYIFFGFIEALDLK